MAKQPKTEDVQPEPVEVTPQPKPEHDPFWVTNMAAAQQHIRHITDKKGKVAAIKRCQSHREKELLARIASSTDYPAATLLSMKCELKAIDRGTWYPGWRLPKKKSRVEQFLEGSI